MNLRNALPNDVEGRGYSSAGVSKQKIAVVLDSSEGSEAFIRSFPNELRRCPYSVLPRECFAHKARPRLHEPHYY